MKFSFKKYVLNPLSELNAQSNQNPREGALLKIEWPGGMIGYADLHPWPELGDIALGKQLGDLESGKISTQLERSVWFAHRDALARKADVSLWSQVPRIKNNFLLSDVSKAGDETLDQARMSGFSTIKIKVGRDFEREKHVILRILRNGNFMLRIDCNGSLRWQDFETFFSGVEKSYRARLDYVEDPFTYDERMYREARVLVRVAVDRFFSKIDFDQKEAPPVDHLILKPAIQDVESFMRKVDKWRIPVTVTSYMDHPVGMVHAAILAGELKKKYQQLIGTSGCLHHHLYQKDVYQAELIMQGPYIQKVGGKGVGFDFLFHQETWSPLNIL
jgi:O-succinylbenzoate synthase